MSQKLITKMASIIDNLPPEKHMRVIRVLSNTKTAQERVVQKLETHLNKSAFLPALMAAAAPAASWLGTNAIPFIGQQLAGMGVQWGLEKMMGGGAAAPQGQVQPTAQAPAAPMKDPVLGGFARGATHTLSPSRPARPAASY